MIFVIDFAEDESDIENAFKRAMPWLGDDLGMKDASSSIFPGLSLVQWMSMQQNNQFSAAQSGFFPPSMLSSNTLHGNLNNDHPSKILNFQAPVLSPPSLQFNKPNLPNQVNQLQQSPTSWPQQQPQQQQQQQQQKLQSLLQSPINQLQQPQQQQRQQQLPEPQNLPQPQQQQPQLPQQRAQQLQQPQQQQQQQQSCPQPIMNSGVVTSNQISNQCVQQPVNYSQLQQQQLISGSMPPQQSIQPATKNTLLMTSLPQDSQFQQQIDQQAGLLQRQQQQTQLQQSPLQFLQQSVSQWAPQQPQGTQMSQQNPSEQKLQLQLLQKLQQQQQQQQLLSTSSPLLQSQLLQQQTQLPQSQHQPQQLGNNAFPMEKLLNSNNFSSSPLMHLQQLPVSQPPQNTQKSLTTTRAPSGLTDVDVPSCSTSPSTNNCQISPPNLLKRNQQVPATLGGISVVEPTNNLIQELHSKSEMQIKHELPSVKGPDQLKYKGTISDQLEASSSGTSYCIDPGNIHQNFPIPNFCIDGDVQSHPRQNLPFASNLDGLAPDTMLSRGYDSQKDLQNLLSNYGGAPRDIETELSTAAISSPSFGVPNMPFKPGCSSDIAMNDTGVLNNGLWANQTQRMRTYTKVCIL